MDSYPLELRLQILANGETVEWTLRAGRDVVTSIYTTEPLTSGEAFKRLLAKALAEESA